MRPPPLPSRTTASSLRAIIVVVALVLILPAIANAELILDAEVRVTAEDNIVGLLSGGGASGTGGSTMGGAVVQAGGKGFGSGPGSGSGSGGSGSYTGSGAQSPGDLSVTIMAELGGSGRAGDGLAFYALGFAERTDYQELSEYDQAAAGVTAGATLRLSEAFAAGLAGTGRTKRYDNDPDRDGTSAIGTVSLKQYGPGTLFFREAAEYETYDAAYQDFSFRGTAYRITAGYDLTSSLLVTAGFRFQSQQYQDGAATVLRTRTTSIVTDYALTRRWSTWLAYERQTTHSGTSDVITRNNILSIALRWAY